MLSHSLGLIKLQCLRLIILIWHIRTQAIFLMKKERRMRKGLSKILIFLL